MTYGLTNLSGSGGKKYTGENPIIPTTSDIIIPKRTLLKEDLIINGDSNLISDNIKEGISIFGVNGSYIYTGNKSYEKDFLWKKFNTTTVNLTIKFTFEVNTYGVTKKSKVTLNQGTYSDISRSDLVNHSCLLENNGATNFYLYFDENYMVYQLQIYYTGTFEYYYIYYTYDYDPKTGEILYSYDHADTSISDSVYYPSINLGNKEIKNFLSYAGSNTSNYYPDENWQNGYFYMKV